MPDDFVASLSGLVDDFAQAVRSREVGKDGIASGRVVVETVLTAGVAAAQDLDIIVANRLLADPMTMAVWARHRKVDYARRTRKASPAVASEGGAPEAPAASPPLREVS